MTLSGLPALGMSQKEIRRPSQSFQTLAINSKFTEGDASPLEIDECSPFSEAQGSIPDVSVDTPQGAKPPTTPQARRKSQNRIHVGTSVINYIPTLYTRAKMYPNMGLQKSKLSLRANINLQVMVNPEKSGTNEWVKSNDRSQSQTLIPSNLPSKPSLPTPGEVCTSPGLSGQEPKFNKYPAAIHSLQSLEPFEGENSPGKGKSDSQGPRSIVLNLSLKKQSMSRLPNHEGDHEVEIPRKREKYPQSAGHKPKNYPPAVSSFVLEDIRGTRKNKLTFVKVRKTSNAPRTFGSPFDVMDTEVADSPVSAYSPEPATPLRRTGQTVYAGGFDLHQAVRPLKFEELVKN